MIKQTLQWSLCDHSSVHTNLMGLCASAMMWRTGGLHAMLINQCTLCEILGELYLWPLASSILKNALTYVNASSIHTRVVLFSCLDCRLFAYYLMVYHTCASVRPLLCFSSINLSNLSNLARGPCQKIRIATELKRPAFTHYPRKDKAAISNM